MRKKTEIIITLLSAINITIVFVSDLLQLVVYECTSKKADDSFRSNWNTSKLTLNTAAVHNISDVLFNLGSFLFLLLLLYK